MAEVLPVEVVIRFQICIFDILNTALAFRKYSILPL